MCVSLLGTKGARMFPGRKKHHEGQQLKESKRWEIERKPRSHQSSETNRVGRSRMRAKGPVQSRPLWLYPSAVCNLSWDRPTEHVLPCEGKWLHTAAQIRLKRKVISHLYWFLISVWFCLFKLMKMMCYCYIVMPEKVSPETSKMCLVLCPFHVVSLSPSSLLLFLLSPEALL